MPFNTIRALASLALVAIILPGCSQAAPMPVLMNRAYNAAHQFFGAGGNNLLNRELYYIRSDFDEVLIGLWFALLPEAASNAPSVCTLTIILHDL